MSLDNVTLVTWPLVGLEHSLAANQQKIRLRRLLDYRLSAKLAGSGEPPRGARSEGPSAPRQLRVANIDTMVRLGGGPIVQRLPGVGTLRLGGPREPALGELKLRGQLEHRPGNPPSAGELRLQARELLLGASIALEEGRHAELEQLAIAQSAASTPGWPCSGSSLGASAPKRGQLRLSGVELRGWFGGAARTRAEGSG